MTKVVCAVAPQSLRHRGARLRGTPARGGGDFPCSLLEPSGERTHDHLTQLLSLGQSHIVAPPTNTHEFRNRSPEPATMAPPVYIISRAVDPLFAVFIGISAAALRINREEKEKGRTTQETITIARRYASYMALSCECSAYINIQTSWVFGKGLVGCACLHSYKHLQNLQTRSASQSDQRPKRHLSSHIISP